MQWFLINLTLLVTYSGVSLMKVLVPLINGNERNEDFVNVITNKVDEIVLLQIVDKDFAAKTSSTIGELRQSKAAMEEIKRVIGLKKKKCVELTEWGSTIQKIVSNAILQKVDKVYFVKQNNQFFEDILKELKNKKIVYEVIELVEKEEVNKK